MFKYIKYIIDFYKIEYKSNSNDNNGFYNFNINQFYHHFYIL